MWDGFPFILIKITVWSVYGFRFILNDPMHKILRCLFVHKAVYLFKYMTGCEFLTLNLGGNVQNNKLL